MSSQDTRDDSALLDFLLLWSEDQATGAARPLEHYLERFPGHERAIEIAFRERTARASPRSEPSERRIGPYRVLRELGRGGQGAVYLAEDTRDRRLVALKVLDSFEAWRSKDRVERLRREASVVAKLQHPAICTVLDADLESDPPFLAMRMVDGRTLAHEIALARSGADAPRMLTCAPRTRLELESVLAFFDRAARALHAAHEAGVVHRDVKPGNIMVTPDGEPVLLDFGLARDADSAQETLTHSGALFGTPAYMAPERVSSPRADPDRRNDVYSLGVTLYEALTLARPFEGSDPEALFRSIAHGAVPDARRTNAIVPYELQVVLATAMEKDPRRRYATALELADELRRVRQYEPILARPSSAARKLLRWSQRHPAIAFTSSASFLILAAGLLVSQHLLRQREEARRRLEGLSLGTLSLTLVDEDPTRSLLLATRSAAIEREYYGDSALFAALAECREAKQFDFGGVICRSADIDRGSRWIAFAGDGKPYVEVRELASGKALPDLAAHTDSVMCVRFAPSGERLVSASRDGRAIVWDVAAARAEHELVGHQSSVRWAEFSPDGTRIATASVDGTARLWDADGRELHVLRGHEGIVTRATFSPDGAHVLTMSGPPLLGGSGLEGRSDATARVWEVATGRELFTLAGHARAITDARFDARGERIVTASEDATVRVWNARDGELLRELRHASPVRCAVLCGDERVIAGDEHGLRAWKLSDGSFEDWRGHLDRPVNALALSPDGKRVVSGSSDVTARIWEVASGRELATLRRADGRITDCRWSADGEWIATTTWSPHLHLWYARDPDGVEVLHDGGAAITDLAFDAHGTQLAAAAADGTLRVWSRSDARWRERSATQHGARLRSVAFDASGARVVAAAEDGTARIVELAGTSESFVLRGHSAAVVGASFAPSGAEALTWSQDGTVRLWRVADAAELRVLRAQEGAVTSAQISPDGRLIVACGAERSIVTFDARSGERRLTLGPFGLGDPLSAVAAFVAFSPDGSQLVASGQDGTVRLIDPGSGAVRELELSAIPGRASFSADGSRLLVATRWNPIAYLFDTRSGARLALCGDRNFGAHTSTFSACELSGDAATILTASNDRTVRLWNGVDGSRRARLPLQPAGVTDACFHPDGRSFATADAQGGVRVWPVDPLPAAIARKPRELTATERERYRDL